jgi:phage shock protein E
MLSFLKSIFGNKSKEVESWLQNGALILDVRTPGEYESGHVRGSVNIPLDKLSASIGKLKKEQPIITCCASGMRSANAARTLTAAGFRAINGGSWHQVNQIKK